MCNNGPMGRPQEKVRRAVSRAFAKARKHQQSVGRAWGYIALFLALAATAFLWRHSEDSHIVRFAADFTPVVITILIAFIPDLRKQHMAWRVAIILVGILWSVLLWKREDLTERENRAAVSAATLNAVSAANAHSDQRIAKVEDLAQEAVGETTGGDSYPVISVLARRLDTTPGVPLLITVSGKYNLLDATIRVISHAQNLRKMDSASIVNALLNPPSVTLPMVPVKHATLLPLRIEPEGKRDEFSIHTTARNGEFAEQLVVFAHPPYYYDTEVTVSDASGKILTKIPRPHFVKQRKR